VICAQKHIEALKDAALGCTAPCILFWGVPDPFIQQTFWQLRVVFPARARRKEKTFFRLSIFR
jgi:hypothetical protein